MEGPERSREEDGPDLRRPRLLRGFDEAAQDFRHGGRTTWLASACGLAMWIGDLAVTDLELYDDTPPEHTGAIVASVSGSRMVVKK